MKTFLLLALLAAAICYYHGPSKPAPTATVADAHLASKSFVAKEIVVAHALTYGDRWKTGPNAFTDLKTGPDAQVTFEPFAPSQQATWNRNPGYTIVASRRIRLY
jgi:hypothetical protein